MNHQVYREIIPYFGNVEKWTDVGINAGTSQSTLQDIKLSDCSGCYYFKESSELQSPCGNRFICWRSNRDILELADISLNINLTNNHLRLRFLNSPVLRGVSINEHSDSVVLLVPTVSAIHRIVFPHPLIHADLSVFADSGTTVVNRCHSRVLNHVSPGSPPPSVACSWMDDSGNANFVMGNSAGSVLVAVMASNGEMRTNELGKSSSLRRKLLGFMGAQSSRAESTLQLVHHKVMNDVLVFGLFSDLHIRVWSFTRQECIYEEPLQNFDQSTELTNFTAHQCLMRKSATGFQTNNYSLAVYVPTTQKKLLYFFSPLYDQGHCKLILRSILFQTQYDLVDFCMDQTDVWTLWLSCTNQPLGFSAKIDAPKDPWVSINLEQSLSGNVDWQTTSPRKAYMKEIFKIGRFPPQIIAKAISIYSQGRQFTNKSMKQADLQHWVLEVVENDIIGRTNNLEMSEAEHLAVSSECWDRFFSYCIQYLEVGTKPFGIAVDSNTGCVVLIKKLFFSMLCPCDELTPLISTCALSYLHMLEIDDRKKLYPGIRAILSSMRLVRENVNHHMLSAFKENFLNIQSPIKYASEIQQSLNMEPAGQFLQKLQTLLPPDVDVASCIHYLLQKLDLANEISQEVASLSEKFAAYGGSSSGVSAICSGLYNFALGRFEFCRDLLLLGLVLHDSDAIEPLQLGSIVESHLISHTVLLLRSYFSILWCTQRECNSVSPYVKDVAFKQFCILEMPEFTNSDLTKIAPQQTVAEVLFSESGGSKMRDILMTKLQPEDRNEWKIIFPKMIVSAATLLWPSEENVLLPEFLYSHCQHTALMEYNQLLSDWCLWNKYFLDFLLASSHLISGDPSKAIEIFINLPHDLESLVFVKLLKTGYEDYSTASNVYYMRVIQMFEQFSLSEYVVTLTRAAIQELRRSDPHLPIFYSILFKHQLTLGNYEDAFSALTANPDPSRQKDGLRQLIVHLCSQEEYRKIIDFSYVSFEEDIVQILESRARCSDLHCNSSFYNVLFSMHVHNGKYRKAAAVMYELAMRIGREVVSLKGLKKQVNCYLAAINCLHLAQPDYAWIVKPVLKNSDGNKELRASPKRDSTGEEVLHSPKPCKMEVLGLEDIKKEFSLSDAHLTYAKMHPNAPVTPLSPEEIVALLLNSGIFPTAISLTKTFSLSMVPIIEALALRCLSTNENSKTYWSLLEKNLHEHSANSELLHCVAQKFLLHNAALPAWLKLLYQRQNVTELLNLYVTHGLMAEALILLNGYIRGVLGTRKEDFGIEFSTREKYPVWIPHTYVDILLDSASYFKHGDLRELYNDFTATLEKYNKTIEKKTKQLTQPFEIINID